MAAAKKPHFRPQVAPIQAAVMNGAMKAPEVDAHVENRETGIAAHVARCVQLADHRRDIRLEQAVAGDDQRQSHQEPGQILDQQHEQPGRHDDGAQQDRSLVAEHVVGDVAADDAGRIDQRRVAAVDQAGLRVGLVAEVTEKRGRHVDGQQRAHAVVGKALPHLDVRELPQRLGVSEKFSGRNARLVNCSGLGAH